MVLLEASPTGSRYRITDSLFVTIAYPSCSQSESRRRHYDNACTLEIFNRPSIVDEQKQIMIATQIRSQASPAGFHEGLIRVEGI